MEVFQYFIKGKGSLEVFQYCGYKRIRTNYVDFHIDGLKLSWQRNLLKKEEKNGLGLGNSSHEFYHLHI